MMNIRPIFIIFLLFLLSDELLSQNKQISITDTTLYKVFEEEAKSEYMELQNLYNILLDNSISDEDKMFAKYLGSKSFNSSANIEDIIHNRRNIYKSYYYFDSLYAAANKKYIFSKDRKLLSDTISFLKNLSKEMVCPKKRFGDMFETNIIYSEVHNSSNLINSPLIYKSNLNINEFNIFKEIKVSLFPYTCDDNVYKLSFEEVKIIDQNNLSQYKNLVKLERANKNESTNVAQLEIMKRELDKITDEKRKKDIILKLQLVSKDTIKYKSQSFVDYLIPGIGHLKIGSKGDNANSRIIRASVYGSFFIGSAIYSIYNKVKSDKVYKFHNEARTIRLSNQYYTEANMYNKKYLIGAGILTLTYFTNSIHLTILDNIQKNRIKQNTRFIEKLSINIHPKLTESTFGSSIVFNF
jgi:hypothetical protein